MSRPPQFPVPHPRVGITPLQPTPKTDVDYDEVPDEEEEDEEEEEGKQALQVCLLILWEGVRSGV